MARGRAAEEAACEELQRGGYRILERNVSIAGVELDVVARHGAALVFVEVRSRSSRRFGGPLATIGREKQRRVVRGARAYLARRPGPAPPARFDVVGVDWVDGRAVCTIVRNAFEAPF